MVSLISMDEKVNLVRGVKLLARLYIRRKSDVDPAAQDEYLGVRRWTDALGLEGGHLVDFAASDGFSQSAMWPFLRSKRWGGLFVEADSKKFAQLAALYESYERAQCVQARITPKNVGNLMGIGGIPRNFELLNLDLDSFDYEVLEGIFCAGYRPKLITMEINEKIPPPVFFSVNYSDAHSWDGDHYYGCSYSAASALASRYGYLRAELNYNNAVFLHERALPPGFKEESVVSLYRAGYVERVDRKDKFPYNGDVDHWLSSDSEKVLAEIEKLFSGQNGKFELYLMP